MLGILLASVFAAQTDQIRVCQVGYLPQETKFAMVVGADAGSATLKDAKTEKVVGTFPIGPPKTDPSSGDTVRSLEFTSLKAPGTYLVEIEGVGKSYTFRIAKDVFAP